MGIFKVGDEVKVVDNYKGVTVGEGVDLDWLDKELEYFGWKPSDTFVVGHLASFDEGGEVSSFILLGGSYFVNSNQFKLVGEGR